MMCKHEKSGKITNYNRTPQSQTAENNRKFEIVDFETTESMSKLLQKTINNSYDILN
jgi:hypothetical protein